MQDQHEGQEATGLDIAIVGMAARVPGAPDIDTFWNNIRNGVESVVHYTDAQLRERGVSQALIDDPHYVKAGVPFEGADQFDAGLFGYTPRDAELLDPQHRIFLECAFEALEHAGYAGQRGGASVGVYAGSGASVYLMRQLLPHYDLEQGGIADLLGLMGGNLPDSLCTRVAYKLDLRGPAVTVQTACSTSLMAVHAACQALLNHECDMALAGGVSLNLLQNGGYRHQAGAILSPDGHCRAFDASAAGTVQGSGAGIVVLKRLGEALRDGDTIHAVIKGSAANNDGADKVGFSAPSVGGQSAVIRAAQLMAGVGPESIGYVEAHGTGTTLGDPIEIAALTQSFQAGAGGKGYCAIGSVKTNVGHLDAAAGVTGLIKAVLALKHRTLPPSLNFERPNPQIDFANSPFYVNTVARAWEAGSAPRRAGVSSFGIGGTNVHVVLEEAVPARVAGGTAAIHALALSARSAPALQTMAARLAGHLEGQPELDLGDVAYTLRTGRKRFAHRAVALVRDRAEAIHALRRQEAHVLYRGEALSERPSVAFLFPGQGAQHVDMGRALYEREDQFRATVDRCCALLQPHLGLDLRTLLFPTPADSAEAAERLAQTAITQPALFVIEYALAQWWMQKGIEPDALLGHSIGEYVAACLAGVFTLDDALAVVAARGRLLQSMVPGAMLAVGLSEQALRARADAGCDLAAVNGAELCVLAGPSNAIEQAERDLAARGVAVRRLHVSHAFHSAAVEPMLDEFAALLARTTLSAPRMAFVSNVSGTWITAQEACDPGYWVRHVRGTVRFADGLDALFAKADRVLLEVGPGNALSTLARRHPQGATRPVLASQCHPDRAIDNAAQPQRCLAQLWVAGVDEAMVPAAEAGRRVPLPTYPFERRSYWIERPAAGLTQAPPAKVRGDLSGWCYVPAWQRNPGPAPAAASNQAARGVVLVMGDGGRLDDRLLTQLHAQERRVVQVERGTAFARRAAHHYVVRPAERDDMEQVLRSVEGELGPVADICHAWSIDAAPQDALEAGFYSLLALVQALDTATNGAALAITVVASGLEDITGTEPLCPEKATLHGLCQVIPQEYPQLSCRLVDVQAAAGDEHRLARQIAAEIDAAGSEPLVAYRGPHRWIRSFVPAPDGAGTARLRHQGVYLITGGLGGIGLALARHLARQWQARLVLLGRRTTPEQLQAVADLQALGVEVLVLQADVADAQQMRDAVAAARKRFGALHGIVHAAGVTGGGMISAHSRATVEPVFAAKVYGTQALLAATAGVPLDFVALCSSLSSLAGGLGKGAYAAANAYLDAAAAAANRTTDTLVVSIGWDGWREVGMAAGMGMPDDVGIATEQGVQLFERIVQGPAQAHVAVSSIDLETRLRSTGGDLLALIEAPAAGERRTEARPPLQIPFAAPSGDIEESLAQLWSGFLGIAPVGCQDNLFELGGDSLLAIQLLAKVRQVYGVEIHPAAFFKAPTVAALALLVEDRLIEQIELAGADSLSTATP